jgi:hypothetical protein
MRERRPTSAHAKGGANRLRRPSQVKGTKLHPVVTTGSFPVFVTIGPGNHHEASNPVPMMERIRIVPRKSPKRVYADTTATRP